MTDLELQEEQEAQEFLDSISEQQELLLKKSSTDTSLSIDEDQTEDEKIMEANLRLIKNANDLISEKITNKDVTLKLSELVSAKDTAFKQNLLIQGKATENFNINVKELKDKTPDELVIMLNALK